MRRMALALAALLGGCFDDEAPTVTLEVDQVTVPMGTDAMLAVWVDGRELERGDAFSWVIDRPDLVTVSFADDGRRVRIAGTAEGFTVIHLGYRTSVVDLPTTIAPPAGP